MHPDAPVYPASITSQTIEVAGFTLTALKQSVHAAQKPGTRILCVHGWLDNAASFVPLMPYIENAEIVAIDLPGHGHSSSLGAAGEFNFLEVALLIPRIIQALGWRSCHLLGHSLGGNLALVASVAAPEMIASLVLLEAAGPPTELADKLPERLKKCLQHRVNPEKFHSRLFATTAQAVASRLAAAKMSTASAELVVERQLRPIGDGYKWRFDSRFRHASSIYLTEEQVVALLQSVSSPTLVVLADDGLLENVSQVKERLKRLANITIEHVPGNHHMHMDEPEPTGQLLQAHLRKHG